MSVEKHQQVATEMQLLSENGQITVFIEFVLVCVQQCYHLVSCKLSYCLKSTVVLIHCAMFSSEQLT